VTSTINYSSPLYYRESGGFSAAKFLPAVLIGALLTAVFGGVYAYCDLYNPCLSVLTVLLTMGFGAVCGATSGRLMRWAEVRNTSARAINSIIVAAVGLYASWVFWLYALITRYSKRPIQGFTPLSLVLHPGIMWRLIQVVNREGAWSIGGHGSASTRSPVTGIALWLCWAAEAVLIVGTCIVTANKTASAFPYCEACGRWAQKMKQLFTTSPMDLNELRSQLESQNYAPLIANSPAKAADATWLEVWTHSCVQCNEFNTMTIKQVTQTVNKKGQLQKTTKTKIAHLMLSTIDLRALENIREQQKNPPLATASAATIEGTETEAESEDNCSPDDEASEL